MHGGTFKRRKQCDLHFLLMGSVQTFHGRGQIPSLLESRFIVVMEERYFPMVNQWTSST